MFIKAKLILDSACGNGISNKLVEMLWIGFKFCYARTHKLEDLRYLQLSRVQQGKKVISCFLFFLPLISKFF